MAQHLAALALLVRDYDEAIAWYTGALGFTLAEIAELLELRLDPRTTAAEVKASARRKLESVAGKIRDLERIRDALTHLAGQCRGGRGPTGDCPLLEALGPLDPASGTTTHTHGKRHPR